MRDLLEIPVLGTALAVILDLVLASGDIVIGAVVFLVVSLGDILPILSVISAYVAPEVAWISESAVSTLILAVALLYVGYQVAKLLGNWRQTDA